MLAYVDENGNITSTPPDARKKRQINEEDIQIGTPKQESGPPQDVVRQGVVTFFNTSKGYGFIKDQQTQESVFVHINTLTEPINEHDKVTFEITATPRGPSATDVKKVV